MDEVAGSRKKKPSLLRNGEREGFTLSVLTGQIFTS